MERLTKRIDGEAVLQECNGPCRYCGGVLCEDVSKVFERLAAYEDTGMEPERVAELAWIIENRELFGREIFLNREEAKAALKKREADNENEID